MTTSGTLERLLAGDRDVPEREAAWEEFLAEHSRLILSVARKLSANRDAAMDAYAFVLDRLHADDCARLRSFNHDGRARFTTWLVVVVRRLCIDHHRSRHGRVRQETDAASHAVRRQLSDLVGDAIDVDALPGRTSAPDMALRRAELAGAVRAAIGRLAPRERVLLAMRFEDELPASRIASKLGYPTQFHVYRHLDRILARLRHELQGHGIGESAP